MDTDAVFQSGTSCGFSASGTTTFTNRSLTVAPIRVHESLCPKTLETTYLQLVLPSGSNPKSIPFEQQFTDLKAGLIAQNLERAFWQGDTGSGDNALARFDGLIKIITAVSGSAIKLLTLQHLWLVRLTSATGGITVSNVIAIIQGVFRAIPAALVDKLIQLYL